MAKSSPQSITNLVEALIKLNRPERALLRGLRSHAWRRVSEVESELAADLLVLPSEVETGIERLRETGFVAVEKVATIENVTKVKDAESIKLTEKGEKASTLLPLVEEEE